MNNFDRSVKEYFANDYKIDLESNIMNKLKINRKRIVNKRKLILIPAILVLIISAAFATVSILIDDEGTVTMANSDGDEWKILRGGYDIYEDELQREKYTEMSRFLRRIWTEKNQCTAGYLIHDSELEAITFSVPNKVGFSETRVDDFFDNPKNHKYISELPSILPDKLSFSRAYYYTFIDQIVFDEFLERAKELAEYDEIYYEVLDASDEIEEYEIHFKCNNASSIIPQEISITFEHIPSTTTTNLMHEKYELITVTGYDVVLEYLEYNVIHLNVVVGDIKIQISYSEDDLTLDEIKTFLSDIIGLIRE